jgi:endogenous inhibitor of DNA gyrase (YacG/DUF329 family)
MRQPREPANIVDHLRSIHPHFFVPVPASLYPEPNGDQPLTLTDILNYMSNICRHCGQAFKRKPSDHGPYCSRRCHRDFQSQQLIQRWKDGVEPGWTGQSVQLKVFVRNYLLEKYNYSCIQCGWNERHPVDGRPLVQIDHIDGNAKNCSEENLRVLCPNCHAMTVTFGARNPTSVRYRTYRAPMGI